MTFSSFTRATIGLLITGISGILAAVAPPQEPHRVFSALSAPTPYTEAPQLYSGAVCDSYSGNAGCSIGEGKTYTRSVSVDWGGGPSFDPEDVGGSAALTGGVSISWSTGTSISENSNCPPPTDPNGSCTCGLQSTAHWVRQQFKSGLIAAPMPSPKWGSPYTVNFPVVVGASSGVPGSKALVEWSICSMGGTCPGNIPECPS